MNWTGGRLQRHSKPNGNHTLRAQKQHFAKVRQQQQQQQRRPRNLSPFCLSAFQVPIKNSYSPQRDEERGQKRRFSGPGIDKSATAQRLGHGDTGKAEAHKQHHTKRPRRDWQASISPISPASRLKEQDQNNHQGNAAHSTKKIRSEDRKAVEGGKRTLDQVKRHLLSRSDWMGLSAARPLNMKFPSAQELDNIGRRRKVAKTDTERKQRVKARIHRVQAPDASLSSHIPLRNTNAMQMEDASIRIGSNIHQTQTTEMSNQTPKAASMICQSESSESMLLDKEVRPRQRSHGKRSSSNFATLAPADLSERQIGNTVVDPSVPLDLVRNSQSFDELKSRSDSLRNNKFPSHPRKPSRTFRRRAADRGTASESSKLSSVVVGQQVLDPTSQHTPTGDLKTRPEVRKTPSHSPDGGQRQLAGALSSDRPLSFQSRCPSDEETSVCTSIGPQEITLKPGHRDIQHRALSFSSSVHRSCPQGRSPFTLELQAREEAQARAGLEHADSNYQSKSSDVDEGCPSISPLRSCCAPAMHKSPRSPTPNKFMPREQCEENETAAQKIHQSTPEQKLWSPEFRRAQNQDQRSLEFIQAGHSITGGERDLPAVPEARVRQSHGSSPVATITTNANANVYQPKSHLENCQNSNAQSSETDFLSHFSPMEGQLDDRLLNISVYNNPARTEHSYIAASSQNSISSIIPAQEDLIASSPEDIFAQPSHTYPTPQVSSIYAFPARPSVSCASAAGSAPHLTPLKDASYILADSTRPLFSRPGPACHFRNPMRSPSLKVQVPQDSHDEERRITSPNIPTRSIRSQVDTFPMNYSPVKQFKKKRLHSGAISERPSSYRRKAPHLARNLVDRVEKEKWPSCSGKSSGLLLSKMSFADQVSDKIPKTSQDIDLRDHGVQKSRHQRTAPSHPFIHASSHQIKQSSHELAVSTPPSFVFERPSPSNPTEPRTPARLVLQSKNSETSPEVDAPIQLPQPFSTPRPMRTPLGPAAAVAAAGHRPGVEPFSTPRPVRSVLGEFKRPDRPIGVGGWEGG